MAKRANYQLNIIIGGKVDKSLGFSVGNATKLLGGLGAGVAATKLITKGLSAAASATKNFLNESVDSAKHYESAMADVAKVVDGLKDANGQNTDAYYKMSDEILDLSTKVPKSAEDIAKIVEAAGQSNIERDQLIDFADAAVKMSVAFDTSAEQAGEWMAVWRTSMNMSQDEVEALADQINYLGNTSSENAQKISSVVTDVGSLGKIAGLTGAEVAALAAATTGVDASVAGTGIKNMIVALSSGTAATKKQKAAFDKLGISATKLSVKMQKDAQGAILDVLKAINKLPGSQQTAVIKDIFGKTSLETVAKLAGNVENLQVQLAKINDPSLYTGSMEQEFAARSATYENQLQLWENTREKFKIEIGGKLLEKLNEISRTALPEVSKALDEISPVLDEVIENIDIGDMLNTAVNMIPAVGSFITDTLPMVPGTIQSMIDLSTQLLPIVQKIMDVINLALAGLNLLTGKTAAAEAIADRKYDQWADATYSAMSSSQKEQMYAQAADRASRATGATSGKSKTVTASNQLTGKQPYNFGVGTPAGKAAQAAANAAKSRTISGSFGEKNKVPAAANGAIVTDPTLIYAGEGGESEAVLPLSKLDAMLSGGTTNNHTQAMTITFAPVINITSDDPQAVRQAVDNGMNEAYEQFKWLMRKYQHDEDRVRF